MIPPPVTTCDVAGSTEEFVESTATAAAVNFTESSSALLTVTYTRSSSASAERGIDTVAVDPVPIVAGTEYAAPG